MIRAGAAASIARAVVVAEMMESLLTPKTITAQAWTREEMTAYVQLQGLSNVTANEIDRMVALANKVVQTSAAIVRMPDKGQEPASVFKVPV